MKHLFAPLAVLAIPLGCLAENGSLTGLYGHGFTAKPDTPVWSITRKGSAYQVISLFADEPAPEANEWSKEERQAFWKEMLWPLNSSNDAVCIGNTDEVICRVPPQSRKKIGWLQGNKSDYFHYDRMGGVMEIKRLSR